MTSVRAEEALHLEAYGDPARGDSVPVFRMTLKDRTTYTLARDGAVLARSDGPNGWQYAHGWHIVGFGTRMQSQSLVTLSEAADGADTGQGWVHDLDHGTYRMWSMPSGHRLARIERLAP